MKLAARLRSLVQGLFHRGRFESRMDEELQFHLETYVEQLVRDGIPREEAYRRAHVEFGRNTELRPRLLRVKPRHPVDV